MDITVKLAFVPQNRIFWSICRKTGVYFLTGVRTSQTCRFELRDIASYAVDTIQIRYICNNEFVPECMEKKKKKKERIRVDSACAAAAHSSYWMWVIYWMWYGIWFVVLYVHDSSFILNGLWPGQKLAPKTTTTIIIFYSLCPMQNVRAHIFPVQSIKWNNFANCILYVCVCVYVLLFKGRSGASERGEWKNGKRWNYML